MLRNCACADGLGHSALVGSTQDSSHRSWATANDSCAWSTANVFRLFVCLATRDASDRAALAEATEALLDADVCTACANVDSAAANCWRAAVSSTVARIIPAETSSPASTLTDATVPGVAKVRSTTPDRSTVPLAVTVAVTSARATVTVRCSGACEDGRRDTTISPRTAAMATPIPTFTHRVRRLMARACRKPVVASYRGCSSLVNFAGHA